MADAGHLTARWSRLDTPGQDQCHLKAVGDQWRLEGSAEFRHARGWAWIEYLVVCDSRFQTLHGRVNGRIADVGWDLWIEREPGGIWRLDDAVIEGLDDCRDLDYGFTPATNLLQLRRAGLAVGDAAEVPAAWIDLPEASLVRLPQRYERRSERTYWYESPSARYAALLEIADSGFVRTYPGLWVIED